jgi:hypothetical protein
MMGFSIEPLLTSKFKVPPAPPVRQQPHQYWRFCMAEAGGMADMSKIVIVSPVSHQAHFTFSRTRLKFSKSNFAIRLSDAEIP